ncbi:hypothetical protein M514_09884 [Trichuris suis]|uniref:Uncharacterized protein n=1 Tax=Trichuris suis TaxID=68888 RepID=A0A085N800_9BILA|nr:hypothetical protein M514_09884 [Trichuris suis]
MVRTYRYNPALTSTFCLAHARGAEDFQTLAHETHLERLASERKKATTALRRRQPKRDLLEESEVSVDDERAATCEKHSGQSGPLRSKAKNPCRSGNDHHLCHKCLHDPCEHFYCRRCMENSIDRECIAHCSNWPYGGRTHNGTDQYFCCVDPNCFYGYSGELCNAFHSNLHNHNCLIAPYAPSFPWMKPADWQPTFSNSRLEANRNFRQFHESHYDPTPSADLSSVPQLNATLPDERVAHDYGAEPKLPTGYSTISTTSPMCRQCAALQSCMKKPYPTTDDRKESQATDLLSYLNRQDRPTMMPTHRLAIPAYPVYCHVEEGASHSCRYLCPYCAGKRQRQNSDERIREDGEAPLDSARISPEDASHCLSCSTVSSGMASLQKEKKSAMQQYDDELMQQIEEKRHAKEQQLIKEREEDRKLIQAIEAVLAKEKQEVYEEQRSIAPHSLKQETQTVKKAAKPAAIPDSRPDDMDVLEWWEKQPEVYKPQTPSTPSEPVPALRFNSYQPRDFEEPLDFKGSQTIDTSFDDTWVQESIDETEKRKIHQTKPKKIRRRYSRWSDWSDDEETNESRKAQQSRESAVKMERPKQRQQSDFATSQKKPIKEKKFAKARIKPKQGPETTTAEQRAVEQLLERETTTIETEDFSSQVDFPDPELDEQPQGSEQAPTE